MLKIILDVIFGILAIAIIVWGVALVLGGDLRPVERFFVLASMVVLYFIQDQIGK